VTTKRAVYRHHPIPEKITDLRPDVRANVLVDQAGNAACILLNGRADDTGRTSDVVVQRFPRSVSCRVRSVVRRLIPTRLRRGRGSF